MAYPVRKGPKQRREMAKRTSNGLDRQNPEENDALIAQTEKALSSDARLAETVGGVNKP